MTARMNGHLRWRKGWANTKFGTYSVSCIRNFRWDASFVDEGSTVSRSLGSRSSEYEAKEICEKDFIRRVHLEYEGCRNQ